MKANNKHIAELNSIRLDGSNDRLIDYASDEVFQELVRAGLPVGSKFLTYAKKPTYFDRFTFLLKNTNYGDYDFTDSDVRSLLLACSTSQIENLKAFGFSLDVRGADEKTALMTLAGQTYHTVEHVIRVKALLAAGADSKLTWKNPSRVDLTASNMCEYGPANNIFRQPIHEALEAARKLNF